MENFTFLISDFHRSYFYFLIKVDNFKYHGTFTSDYDALTSFIHFLEQLALNKRTEYVNWAPNNEHAIEYIPNGVEGGHLIIRHGYYEFMDDEDKKILYEANVRKREIVSKCFTAIKKLYKDDEFINYQHDPEANYHYPLLKNFDLVHLENYLIP